MHFVILAMYIVTFISVLTLTLPQYERKRVLEQSMGKIYKKWSERLNFAFWQGRLRWVVLVFGLLFIIHWIIFNTDQNYGHAGILTLFLIISFYPRWTVKFGEKGIILNMRLFLWHVMKSWHIYTDKNNILLELKFQNPDSTRIIKMPPKYVDEIEDILLKEAPEKEDI